MHLQLWKLWGILAKADGEADTAIYNSRNYWSILALRYQVEELSHIYNSRNYWSILAFIDNVFNSGVSTIVEIIEVY